MLETIQSIDFSILNWIQEHLRCGFLDVVAPPISSIANGGILWLIIAFGCQFMKRTRKCGMTMFLAMTMGFIIGDIILKALVARERPCVIAPPEVMLVSIPHSTSFPSGHSTAAFASALSIFHHHRKVGIAAIILAVFIAFTRLYLYVHFPTDVLAGITLGIVSAVVVSLLTDKYLWERLDRKFPKLFPHAES